MNNNIVKPPHNFKNDIIYGTNLPKSSVQRTHMEQYIEPMNPYTKDRLRLGAGSWVDLITKGLPILDKSLPILGKIFEKKELPSDILNWNKHIMELYNVEKEPRLKIEILKQLKKSPY